MSGPVLLILRFLMAASLYAFLGLAFYLLLADFRQQTRLIASHKPVPISLTFTSDENGWTRRFTLGEVLIGRDPGCDCDLEDTTVSAQHARLVYRQGQWWIEDLHSTNGTFLNQDPVLLPLVVTSGDLLRCGQMLMKVTVETSA